MEKFQETMQPLLHQQSPSSQPAVLRSQLRPVQQLQSPSIIPTDKIICEIFNYLGFKNRYSFVVDNIADLHPGMSAKILLDQNKVLFTNLISKNSIIVPKDRLEAIIKAAVGKPCEITIEEDTSCCIAKYSPIKKVESIKIINEDLVIDFKQVYNSIYNELNSKYFLNLKYAVEV